MKKIFMSLIALTLVTGTTVFASDNTKKVKKAEAKKECKATCKDKKDCKDKTACTKPCKPGACKK